MSNSESDFDLEKMFLPAWAKETPSDNRFAHYTGTEGERPPRRGDRRGGPGRREGGGGGPRGQNRPQDRPPGQGRPFGQERPFGQGRPPRRDDGRRGDDRRGRPGQGQERREFEERRPEVPLPEMQASVCIDAKDADSLARQIRVTGRAYPIFDIAYMILQKPDRFQVAFSVMKKPDGQIAQPLYLCALDDTLWLNEAEAVDYLLDRHFNMFYQADRTATQPPKGVYTFVAQCGLSGVILGPPNYHGYQDQLRKLHAERFSRMPFEVFKSRVRIVRDEAIVKKWLDDQSWKTEYICLNVPDSPRLANRESVVQHFRETHLANVIQQVESHTISGAAARNLRSAGLQRLARRAIEEQRRFPIKLVNHLSQQFAARGLQFFKREKSVTHVSVARPHYLDLETSVVSDLVKRIIDFINTNPKCTRPKLVEALAPTPVALVAPVIPVTPPPAAEPAPAPEPVSENAAAPAPTEAAPAAPAPAAPAAPVAPPAPEPTSEQLAVITDLHWLVHQGHVIEFANGILETAKKPLPRPPKPQPETPAPAPAEATAQPAADSAAQPAEAAAQPAETAPAETSAAAEPAVELQPPPEVAVQPASPAPAPEATETPVPPAVEPPPTAETQPPVG